MLFESVQLHHGPTDSNFPHQYHAKLLDLSHQLVLQKSNCLIVKKHISWFMYVCALLCEQIIYLGKLQEPFNNRWSLVWH